MVKMNTKSSKRKQKRNTDDELFEINEKNLSPKKIDLQLDQIFKDDISEHSEVSTDNNEHKNDTEETNGHKIETENGTQNGNDHHDSKNGFHEDSKEKLNENHEIIEEIVIETTADDDLHLSLNVTPEKQTEQTEIEKSPVLTGRTTRSHKNSPKVDIPAENGTDTKLTDDVHVNLTPLDEKTLENLENKTTELKDSGDTKVEETKVEETEEKDTTNASIFVNVGNDTTHNVDITTTSVVDDTASFIDSNKDVPYAQAIRTLSGRRGLRRDSPFVPNRGKIHLDKVATDSRRSYIPHISSVKRKNTTELPDDQVKRHKTENSPGIFSYIASPLASFRNRLSRSELPSSTPKLTSYNKYAPGNNIIEDMSQIDDLSVEEAIVADTNVEPKKWCSIM